MARCVEVMPCLDLRDGRVVKGVQFEGLTDVGQPLELAQKYARGGADVIAALEVSGTESGRLHLLELLRAASEEGTPLLAGGGVDSVESAAELIDAGASMVSVSSAAVRSPQLINHLSESFGSEAVVVSADVKTNVGTAAQAAEDANHASDTSDSRSGAGAPHLEGQKPVQPRFEVTVAGGKVATGKDALEWVEEVERRGAGAIMLNSISTDGAKGGYDIELLRAVKERVSIPVVASGGAGRTEDFLEGAREGADVVLAASVFHFGQVSVQEVQEALAGAGFRECE